MLLCVALTKIIIDAPAPDIHFTSLQGKTAEIQYRNSEDFNYNKSRLIYFSPAEGLMKLKKNASPEGYTC
jgi:hypothetical protein